MKVRYTTANGRIEFESQDGLNVKAAFAFVAAVQELFEESACGQCGCTELKFDKRTYDSNDYYKLVCNKCQASLDYGQKKDGVGMFPKRVDADKKPVGKNGWYHWQQQPGGGGKSSGSEFF